MRVVGSTGIFLVWNKMDLLTEHLTEEKVAEFRQVPDLLYVMHLIYLK
jgi:ribosome biogenesis GTPase A